MPRLIWKTSRVSDEESDLDSFASIFPDHGTKAVSECQLIPEWTIQQVSQCRVVITGTYHAAAFALSQGIPATCLAKSEYYEQKFLGLADQFGPSRFVIALRDSGFEARIIETATAMWYTAAVHDRSLLDAARKQIEASEAVGPLDYQAFRANTTQRGGDGEPADPRSDDDCVHSSQV